MNERKKPLDVPESDPHPGGADAVRAGQTFEFLAGKIVQLAKNGNLKTSHVDPKCESKEQRTEQQLDQSK